MEKEPQTYSKSKTYEIEEIHFLSSVSIKNFDGFTESLSRNYFYQKVK